MRNYNPKFQVKLTKIFNKAFSGYDSKIKDQLRVTLADPTFRNIFGKMVIEEIITRTEGGIDRNGEKFASYSNSYKQSDIFKIYNKNPSEVNLTLTGEMLASLKPTITNSEIVVELIGNENKAKAHGHKYGLGKRKVKRDFLGLPDEELGAIMEEAMRIARNDAFQATIEYFENTSISDFFGQVGNQNEIGNTLFTDEALAQIARGLGLESD